MEIKKINGVIVAIIGRNKLNRWLSENYTLNGYMFLDWVKKDLVVWAKRDGTKYKLQSTKTSFIADNDNYECYRYIVDIEDNVEYMEFLNGLYDCLQDYLKSVKRR